MHEYSDYWSGDPFLGVSGFQRIMTMNSCIDSASPIRPHICLWDNDDKQKKCPPCYQTKETAKETATQKR
ncbi:unnamed protein product [Merluccius merluccius]